MRFHELLCNAFEFKGYDEPYSPRNHYMASILPNIPIFTWFWKLVRATWVLILLNAYWRLNGLIFQQKSMKDYQFKRKRKLFSFKPSAYHTFFMLFFLWFQAVGRNPANSEMRGLSGNQTWDTKQGTPGMISVYDSWLLSQVFVSSYTKKKIPRTVFEDSYLKSMCSCQTWERVG